VDVPNAITPNGDNINDMVYVRGFGIDKMDWKIYNRWGTMIFRATDQNTGWDGKYKGALQPQEVYMYVLDVQFSDGTQYRKKGDITLLR
jgi:gliding motility-associated-like protein